MKVHNVNRIIMVGPLNSFGSWIDEFESCFGKKRRTQLSKYKGNIEILMKNVNKLNTTAVEKV